MALVAFFVAPDTLAAGISGGAVQEDNLAESFRRAFVEYWSSGDRQFNPDLARVVDYWLYYHVVKGVIAAVLLVVSAALGVRLWKAFVRSGALGPARRAAVACAGVLVTVLATLSLVTVMANIQGAAAPFSSLLPMLPLGEPHGELAGTLGQVRQGLADSGRSGHRTPPAVDVMVSDFARYHLVLAIVAVIVAVTLIGLTVVSWRRFATTASSDRRARRVLVSFGVLSVVLSLVVIMVAVANTGTAADPTPALLAFFEGGR